MTDGTKAKSVKATVDVGAAQAARRGPGLPSPIVASGDDVSRLTGQPRKPDEAANLQGGMNSVKKTAKIRGRPFDGTPGPGRPKGVRNKATKELGEAARAYTASALETLHRICLQGESEAARVSAACALLDRGHGKPKQQQEVKLDSSDAFLKVWQAISNGTANG